MIFRINKTKNYTVMSNYHLKEKRMSLKAKGLLSIILSLPDDWDYSQAGLVELSSDQVSSVRNALAELKKFGYIQVIKKKPNETNSGRYEYEYIVYEEPQIDIREENNENNENYFSLLWERFPRKEAEKQARTYFNSLNVNEELFDEMLEAINRQRRWKRWADITYVPTFLTWLKNERWKDVIPESQLSNFDIDDWAKEKGCKW